MALSDQALLSQDSTFIGRVKEAIVQTCNSISSETVTGLTGTMPIQLHILRARQGAAIMNLIDAGSPNWPQRFAIAVANDPTSIAAALAQAGGPLTSGNVAAAAAAVTDTDILNAISAAFNSFLTIA